MNEKVTKLGMNISILERVMKIYYNRGLEEFEIGWGQQFFLECVCDNPGITPQELKDYVHVDKATVTKVIKTLLKLEYITVQADETDKRVRHVFLTEKAKGAVARIRSLHQEFYEDLTMGIDRTQVREIERHMDTMIENLTKKVRYKMERK